MITQSGFDELYMSYIYRKVRERFSFLPSVCGMERKGDTTEIAFKTEREYCPYVRRFAEENIADVISVGYKYAYFDKKLQVPLLSPIKKRILITALVAADYKDDRSYVARRIKNFDSYCLDGVFHFRLQELKKRWEGIAEYIPTDMGEESLDGFLSYLTEDGTGKIFLKDNQVYGEDYRPLTRSLLTGVESTLGEIILGGAEHVYCFGDTDKETKGFLKKYYGEKAIFC